MLPWRKPFSVQYQASNCATQCCMVSPRHRSLNSLSQMATKKQIELFCLPLKWCKPKKRTSRNSGREATGCSLPTALSGGWTWMFVAHVEVAWDMTGCFRRPTPVAPVQPTYSYLPLKTPSPGEVNLLQTYSPCYPKS